MLPRAQLLLCQQVELPEDTPTVGMNIVLGAAEGEIVADPDVQKAALYLLITCIYAPIKVGRTFTRTVGMNTVLKVAKRKNIA